MNLTVNGKAEILEQDTATVTDLLKVFDVSQPDMVSVQLNGGFVKRENFETTSVKEADEVDFLYFMGGGCLSPTVSGLRNTALI